MCCEISIYPHLPLQAPAPQSGNMTVMLWALPSASSDVELPPVSSVPDTRFPPNPQPFAFATSAKCGLGLVVGQNGIVVYAGMAAVLAYNPPGPFETWTNVAVRIVSDGVPELFINGVSVATGVAPACSVVYAPMLGGSAAGGFYLGQLDQLALFNTALSDVTLLAVYTDAVDNARACFTFTSLAMPSMGLALVGSASDAVKFSTNSPYTFQLVFTTNSMGYVAAIKSCDSVNKYLVVNTTVKSAGHYLVSASTYRNTLEFSKASAFFKRTNKFFNGTSAYEAAYYPGYFLSQMFVGSTATLVLARNDNTATFMMVRLVTNL